MKNLNDIFNSHNCDKGSNTHHYYKVYELFFEDYRDEEINILEIGVYKGTSIRSFLEYFSKAKIYCVDVFERHSFDDPIYDDLKANDRVKLIEADSTKPCELHDGDIRFDFIIDDGNHNPLYQHNTFNQYWGLLKEGGSYFIEDVWPQHLLTESQIKRDLKIAKVLNKYKTEDHDAFLTEMLYMNANEWSLLDQSERPNSFIFEISKDS